MRKTKRNSLLIMSLCAIAMTAATLLPTKAKAGPFGKCGEFIIDTQDINDSNRLIVTGCVPHFFRCQCEL